MTSNLPFRDNIYPDPEHPFPLEFCDEVVNNGPRRGQQCRRAAISGGKKCWRHGAQLPVVQNAARNMVLAARLEMMGSVVEAAETLYDLSQNAMSEAVRLKSATEILDRSGIRGGTELDIKAEVTDTRAVDEISNRLSKLAAASTRDGAYGRPAADDDDDDEDSTEEDGGQMLLPTPAEPEPVEGELLFPPGYTRKHRTAGRIAAILPPANSTD